MTSKGLADMIQGQEDACFVFHFDYIRGFSDSDRFARELFVFRYIHGEVNSRETAAP